MVIGEVRFGNLTKRRSRRDGTWLTRKRVGVPDEPLPVSPFLFWGGRNENKLGGRGCRAGNVTSSTNHVLLGQREQPLRGGGRWEGFGLRDLTFGSCEYQFVCQVEPRLWCQQTVFDIISCSLCNPNRPWFQEFHVQWLRGCLGWVSLSALAGFWLAARMWIIWTSKEPVYFWVYWVGATSGKGVKCTNGLL